MNHLDQEKLEATKFRRIEVLFEQGVSASIGSINAAILATLILYIESQNIAYFIWSIPVIFISTLRFILSKWFIKKSPPHKDYHRYCRYYNISAFLAGASWGSIFIIDMTNLSNIYQIITFLLLVFISFGAISTYAAVLLSISIFISSLLLVSVALILLVQGLAYANITLLILFIYPTLMSSAKMFNKNIIESLSKQLRVEKLLLQIEETNEQLEGQVLNRTKDLVKAKERAEYANHAKSEFLANVTHELRTPMHAILSFSELGNNKSRSAPVEKIENYFQKINKSGLRLLEFVDTLLDLSKMESGQYSFHPDTHKLNKVIEQCIIELDTLLVEKQIKISFSMEDTVTEFIFDRSAMHQVITNLLSNAIKFSPQQGTINISLSQISNNICRFVIQDQGMGIPAEELETIFEQFRQSSLTRTGAGGTGLGLSICKKIISLHNGKIWAENCNATGACFCFELPLKGR